MDLSYAFVAKYAEFSEGRLNVFGGDFDVLPCESFPATFPSLALIVKLLFRADECGLEYHITAELGQPGKGSSPLLQSVGAFAPRANPSDPAATVSLGAIVMFIGPTFPAPGVYPMRISLEDRLLKTIDLRVVPTPVSGVQAEGTK